MTRGQALDVMWTAMMLAVPLGADRPNTDDDRREALTIIRAFTLALVALGVTADEIEAAQVRYIANIASV